MIRKIKVSQLRAGMFVHDFNCSWLEHPFFKNQLMIETKSQIDRIIAHGIRELYIDTGLGADLPEEKPPDLPGAKVVVEESLSDRLSSLRKTRLSDEILKAMEIRENAIQLLVSMFEKVKAGEPINLKEPRSLVERMVESTHRNSDALPCLVKLDLLEKYVMSHSINVSVLLIAFARSLDMPPDTVVEIGIGGLLHDIGKVMVDQHILAKKEPLTNVEYLEMKKHVVHTHNILSKTSGISRTTLQVAVLHHERFNGSGYPRGLKGDQIPRVGQMAGIVDMYDAITSDRDYSEGLDLSSALKELFKATERGEFEFELVHLFVNCMGLYPIGTLVRLASEKLGIVVRQNAHSLLLPVVKVVYDLKADHFVRPREVDLASPEDETMADKILNNENPSDWKINPMDYIY